MRLPVGRKQVKLLDIQEREQALASRTAKMFDLEEMENALARRVVNMTNAANNRIIETVKPNNDHSVP